MKKKIIIITSIIVIIAIILAAVFLLKKEKEEAVPVYVQPCIYLPSEGGYVQAWTPYLSQIARTVDVPEVTIKTYTTYTELELLFENADRLNLLWAEVPASSLYPLHKLKELDILYPLNNIDVSTNFPEVILNELSKQTKLDESLFLPLSYDPWIFIKKAATTSVNFQYQYAIGAYEDSASLAFIAYVRNKIMKDKNLGSVNDAITESKNMLLNGIIQKNPHNYTLKSAQNIFNLDTTRFLQIPLSYFNSLSTKDQMEFSIQNISTCIIADVTIAVFPKRSKEKTIQAVNQAQNYLLIPEILYATANSRKYMPLYLGTVTRSIYTYTLSKQTQNADCCIIPDFQYSTTQEKETILEALHTVMRNASE